MEFVENTFRISAETAPLDEFNQLLNLKLKLNEKNPQFFIDYKNENWHLRDVFNNKICISFSDMNYKRTQHLGKNELLLKALGSNFKQQTVYDLTAGLGRDAIFLAQAGAQVVAVERNPLLHFLLVQAQRRSKDETLQKINFVRSEAIVFLQQISFGLIYFDPMFTGKKKSALPRQEMLLFKNLVGADSDSAQVALEAQQRSQRLVIKRPLKAEELLKKPNPVFKGTTIRYDVYIGRKSETNT